MHSLDLKNILKNLTKGKVPAKVVFEGLCSDHRKVQPGDLFVAIKGTSFDSHTVLKEVIARRPAYIIAEKIPKKLNFKNFIVVKNSRIALDCLAYFLSGEPSKDLFVAAVTGTSGKTTTTHMIEHILNKLGIPTGVIGTNDHHLGSKVWGVKNTTPGSEELYSRVNEMKELGAKGLTIEASSHALDQHRMDSLKVDAAVFTNLSRDHLDYHNTLAKYLAAKNKLFKKDIKLAVINADDKVAKKIKVPPKVKKLFYGKKGNLKYKILSQDFTSIQIQITFGKQIEVLKLPAAGEYNISNALAAIGAVVATGQDFSKIVQALSDFKSVRGRLELVPNAKGVNIFVDYAHKPDALQKVLVCLNNIRKSMRGTSQIITVFGCGGGRDPGKRPLMAKIAASLSDRVIVTSDNPRSEDPEAIIQDIFKGFKKTDIKKVMKFTDRKTAIEKAIAMARPDDVVLIAGKGHETYQIIGNKTFDFDDVQVVRDLLA